MTAWGWILIVCISMISAGLGSALVMIAKVIVDEARRWLRRRRDPHAAVVDKFLRELERL